MTTTDDTPPNSPALPPEPKALRKRVVGLAWPIISENLLETMLGIVDTAMVAALGSAAIAGVGTGQQMMFFVLAALAALSIGNSVLVAQAVGAKSLDRAGHLARQSLIWSLFFSIPLALTGVLLSHYLVKGFGVAEDVSSIAIGYFEVTMATAVVLVALVIGSGVLRGAGDSRTPMVVTLIANILNVILAYGLIYGHFGLPNLGPVGSAWATFVARAVALALLLRVLWKGRNGVSISGAGGGWRPEWSVAKQVLKLGVPAAMEQMLIASAFVFLTGVVAHLGTDTLAAQRISMSALSFSFMPGFGFSIAATTLVGQSIGAKKPLDAAAVAKTAATWAVIWMGSIGLVIMALAEPIMHRFTSDPEVIRIGAAGLRIVALTQPAWAIGMVHSGALRGSGDTRFPMIISASGVWTAVLLAALLTRVTNWGLPAVWCAFLCTSPVTATLTCRRFYSRIKSMADAQGETSAAPASAPEPLAAH